MAYAWKKHRTKKRSPVGKLKSKDKMRVPGQLLPTEHEEQVIVVCYAKSKGLLFYAIPNAGLRSLQLGARMKAEGLSTGVPDLCFPMPMPKENPNDGHYHGLYIELKRIKGGVVKLEQRYWIENLRQQGMRVEVVRGHEEAINLINEYFGFV